MRKIKLAVCLPTRGLIHSRTMEQVLENVAPYRATLLFTHDLPIPDSFNDLIERALALDVTHVWIVEEDMSIASDTLAQMLMLHKPIVSVDLPVAEKLHTLSRYKGYTLTATGCMLIDVQVFAKLKKPYFRSVARDQSTLKIIPNMPVWGGQDYDFCIRAQDAGFEIAVLPEPAGQYRVAEYGAPQTNDGYHKVIEWRL